MKVSKVAILLICVSFLTPQCDCGGSTSSGSASIENVDSPGFVENVDSPGYVENGYYIKNGTKIKISDITAKNSDKLRVIVEECMKHQPAGVYLDIQLFNDHN
uniref:Uncharacterized protein n=1 Tax=Trichobilharzia regenti TaxID=157069 RepID=A0AA85IXY2_TRIRE